MNIARLRLVVAIEPAVIRLGVILLCVIPLCVITLGPAAARAAERPNVILILADDLGARDLGCFGSTFYETPAIDRLAARGVRLTSAYAASPLCSPTRASILTGLHPARIGITAPACHLPTVQLEKRLVAGGPNARVLVADSLTRLEPRFHTLAEAFGEAGYATAHFGKWHLGHDLAVGDAYEPRDQGFGLDWPHTPKAPGPGGGGGYLAPWKFIADRSIRDVAGRHIDQRMADEAGAFIRASKGRPFFLNFWLFSVHSPWNAPPDLIERFAAKADAASPQRNPLYAAMVKGMDDAVGRLLDHLEASGEADDTLIVLWSDNGGFAYPPKKTDPEGYADIPATSNLPYRSGKASIYEGGTRVPGIVVWPGRVKAGSTADVPIVSTDLYPTLLAACGVPRQPGQPLDGFDQTAALGGGESPRRDIFCHFPHGSPPAVADASGSRSAKAPGIDGFSPSSSVRSGSLKLIRFYAGAADGSDAFELYDLAEDPGERDNLAAGRPDDVARLTALLQSHLLATEAVIPRANPAFSTVPMAVAKASPGRPAAADDLPGGWKNRAGAAIVRDGVLRVESKGPGSFLGVGARLPEGTGRLSFRIRAAAAGEGRIALAAAADGGERVSVPYPVAGGSAWQTVSVELPVREPTGILRLYLPSGSPAVELDDILLSPAEGTPRRWAFE